MKTINYLLIHLFFLGLAVGSQAQWQFNGTSMVRLTDNTDNVGIGFSSPSYKLDVLGDMRVTSDLTISNVGAKLILRRNSATNESTIEFRKFMNGSSTYEEDGYIRILDDDMYFKAGASSLGNQLILESSGNLTVNGNVNSQNIGGNATYSANGAQAIWYDGDYFSWGFGGSWNRFGDPITIGNATEPKSNHALVSTGGDDWALVGNNSYIYWHTGANEDYSGSHSAFIGSNQFGGLFMESNLAGAYLDGETETVLLVSDVRVLEIDGSTFNTGLKIAPDAMYALNVGGNVNVTGELTAASDARLKKNIEKLSNAISVVKELNPVSYEYRTAEFENMKLAEGHRMGFLAQDVENVLPELVSTSSNIAEGKEESFHSKSVNYIELIPVLTKAMQEQQETIEKLEARINEFEATLTSNK